MEAGPIGLTDLRGEFNNFLKDTRKASNIPTGRGNFHVSL